LNRYPVDLFPMAAPEPAFEPVPLEALAIKVEVGSMSDNTRALVDTGKLFPKKGRRGSLWDAARDMVGREWSREDAVQVLSKVGEDLGLEGPDLRDVRRLVRNAFKTPATPGFAAAETATIDFEAAAPPAYDEDLERMPLPEPPPWPDRPDLALGHGLLGDLVGQLEDQTESDAVALAVQFIAGFGSIVGRGPHFMVGATRHGTNLFTTIVGETGKARKGTGLDLVQHVLRFADPQWADECISTNLSSGEGVIENLRDPVEKMVQDKKTGQFNPVVIDEGVADKRLLVTCTELAGPLRASRSERSTLSPVLREAWDAKNLRTMNKNTPRKATDPHLSLICHVTREELVKLATESDVFGGLFNRFLWPVSKRARFLPHGGDLDGIHGLTDHLRDLVAQAKDVGRMTRSPRANKLWEQVYPGLVTVPEGGILGAVLGRGEAQTLRLSMIFALLAGRDKVDREDLAAALDLWNYCAASARLVFGKAEAGITTRIVEILRASPGLSRSDLHRRTGWRVEAKELLEALSRLQSAGALRRETVETGGRPSERWYPTDRDGEEAFRTEEKTLIAPPGCEKGRAKKPPKSTAETTKKAQVEGAQDPFHTQTPFHTQEPGKALPFPDLSRPLKPGTYSL
jgi:DNA-binding PadR family transcriptional regulator